MRTDLPTESTSTPFSKWHRDECRIPELFDKIIVALKSIIDSGQLDSIKAVKELTSLVATLEKAKKGSYFATKNAWGVLITWMKNSGWELLSDVPGLGAIVRGLRTTLEETDEGLFVMHENMGKSLKAEFTETFPAIEFKRSTFPALPAPSDNDSLAVGTEPSTDD